MENIFMDNPSGDQRLHLKGILKFKLVQKNIQIFLLDETENELLYLGDGSSEKVKKLQ